MLHTKKYRQLQGEYYRYLRVLKDLEQKIMNITGLNVDKLPVINDALWDSDPLINYTEDRRNGMLNMRSAPFFFEILAEYTKMKDKHHQQSRTDSHLLRKRQLHHLSSNDLNADLKAAVLRKCHRQDGSQLSDEEVLRVCKNSRIALYVDLTL